MVRLNKIILLLLAVVASSAWKLNDAQADQPTALLEVAGQNVNPLYKGDSFHLDGSDRLADRFTLGVSADHVDRVYGDGTPVQDTIFAIRGTTWAAERTYIETSFAQSTTADIYARWSAIITPHQLIGTTDYSLGFRYDEYKRSTAGSLIPGVFHSFSDDFGIGLSAYLVRTNTLSTAVSGQVFWRFLPRHTIRVILAGGRTIEDAGIVANFTSETARYMYRVCPHWEIGIFGGNYSSDIRKEQSLGLALGYK